MIGVDWGGTKIEAIVLSPDGHEEWRHRVPTPRGDYAASLKVGVELVQAAEAAVGRRCTVGVGIPGSLNPQTGLVRNANSTCLNGQPFAADFAAAIGRPVRMENDANCLAVSEAVDGAGAGRHVVMGIILGTGHGSGIAIDGRAHRGRQGLAGEIGHYSLPWPRARELPGPLCWCGRRGCMEMWCSGTGLERDHFQVTGVARSAREIIAGMRAGDRSARASYNRFADRLARALALQVDVLDPDIFVLGGGMSNVDELYRDLPGLMRPYVFSDDVDTPIARAIHGDSSGVRGAAWLWKDVQPDAG